jgi:hypothetical protein
MNKTNIAITFAFLISFTLLGYCCAKLDEQEIDFILNNPPNYEVTNNTIILGYQEINFKYITTIKHTKKGVLIVEYDTNQGSSLGHVYNFMIKPEPFLTKYRSWGDK